MEVEAYLPGMEGTALPPGAHEDYTIRPADHFFSKSFTVIHKEWPTWVISTNKYTTNFFDPRAHFWVNNANTGELIAHAIKDYGFTPRGIWNLSFLGLFRPHTLSDFNVYDKNGEHIGFIDGRVLALSKARFDFQNKQKEVVAYACQEGAEIKIRDVKTDGIIGYMRRVFEQGCEDSWKVSLQDKMDPRAAFVFAAYVVAHQSAFIQDT